MFEVLLYFYFLEALGGEHQLVAESNQFMRWHYAPAEEPDRSNYLTLLSDCMCNQLPEVHPGCWLKIYLALI